MVRGAAKAERTRISEELKEGAGCDLGDVGWIGCWNGSPLHSLRMLATNDVACKGYIRLHVMSRVHYHQYFLRLNYLLLHIGIIIGIYVNRHGAAVRKAVPFHVGFCVIISRIGFIQHFYSPSSNIRSRILIA